MADYLSQFTGSEIDSRLAKVPQLETGKQDKLVSGTNIKTVNGASILGSGDMTIQTGDPNAVKFVAQTLTEEQKAQARANIDAASLDDIANMDFVTAATLPTASASTMGHIYLIGPDENDNYDRYFTQEDGSSYSWVSLGSTQIDLSTYATKSEVSQLEAKVDGINETYSEQTVSFTNSSCWDNNNGVITNTNSGVLKRANPIDLPSVATISLSTTLSWSTADAAYFCDDSGNIVQVVPRSDQTTTFSGNIPTGATKVYINFASTFSLQVTAQGEIDRLENEISAKQDTLTFDNVPTEGSNNPVKSGGVYDAIQGIGPSVIGYVEPYLAVEAVDNSTPLPLTESDFQTGNINGTTGANTQDWNTKLLRTTNHIPVVKGTSLGYSINAGYTISIYMYDAEKNYLGFYEDFTGTGTTTTNPATEYIRYVLYDPNGTISYESAGGSVTPAKVYAPTRAAAEDTVVETAQQAVDNYFSLERPILAPSPQLPADGSEDSDFNAETLTSVQLQTAIETLIGKLSVPAKYYYPNNPKYGTIYETVAKDASGIYDIKAYVFTRRNRFAWRCAAALYAWKSGATTYYTDHRSPLVGDAVYSDNARTASGYSVTAYNSAGPSITVNGNTYTRDDTAKVGQDIVFTKTELTTSASTISVFNSSDSSLGTATVSSATALSFGGKTYTRRTSADYHTDNKATIVLWGNEHGPQSDPNEPSIILFRLVKDLCGGVGNEFLTFLHNYCKVVIIPVANPYGVSEYAGPNHRSGRNNYNNVNINRNFDTPGWGVQVDADKGSYAGDQPETQFIMNTALDVDADIAIDIHCLGYATAQTNEGRTHFSGAVSGINDKVEGVMNGYCGMSYSTYGGAVPDEEATGSDWIYSAGIVGGLIEMNAGLYALSYDGNQHTAEIMFADYTLLLNTIRMWYYNFDSTINLSKMSIK